MIDQKFNKIIKSNWHERDTYFLIVPCLSCQQLAGCQKHLTFDIDGADGRADATHSKRSLSFAVCFIGELHFSKHRTSIPTEQPVLRSIEAK